MTRHESRLELESKEKTSSPLINGWRLQGFGGWGRHVKAVEPWKGAGAGLSGLIAMGVFFDECQAASIRESASLS